MLFKNMKNVRLKNEKMKINKIFSFKIEDIHYGTYNTARSGHELDHNSLTSQSFNGLFIKGEIS